MSPNAAKPSRKLNKIKNTPDTTGKTKPSGKEAQHCPSALGQGWMCWERRPKLSSTTSTKHQLSENPRPAFSAGTCENTKTVA